MPNLPETVQGSGGRIVAWAKKNPALAVGALAGVAVLAVIAIKNNKGDGSTTDQTGAFEGVGPEVSPIPDQTFPEVPPIDGGGNVGPIGGGGGHHTGGGGYVTDAGAIVTPDAGSMSILDFLWANSQLTGEPLPFDPAHPLIFETPQAEALIQSVGGLTDSQLAGYNQILSGGGGGLTSGGSAGPGGSLPGPVPTLSLNPITGMGSGTVIINGAPVEVVATRAGRGGGIQHTTGPVDWTPVQNEAADIVTSITDWAANIVNNVNNLFGGLIPGPTMSPGGSLSPGSSVSMNENLQPTGNLGGTGAGVTGSADIGRLQPGQTVEYTDPVTKQRRRRSRNSGASQHTQDVINAEQSGGGGGGSMQYRA